jgi:hypothetical protein
VREVLSCDPFTRPGELLATGDALIMRAGFIGASRLRITVTASMSYWVPLQRLEDHDLFFTEVSTRLENTTKEFIFLNMGGYIVVRSKPMKL